MLHKATKFTNIHGLDLFKFVEESLRETTKFTNTHRLDL